MKIRIGLAQYSITKDGWTNWKRAELCLKRLKKLHPHFVVLPEMWLGGPRHKKKSDQWETLYQRVFPKIKDFSRDGMGVVFSQLEKQGSHFYNTAYFLKDGRIQAKYRKIHLFRSGGEGRLFSAGNKVVSFESPWGKIGLVICYDIRFPELIRKLATSGVRLLLVCAQWPASRQRHWETLLRARAIENQFFVVAANRLGVKGNLIYNGGSTVINPWGEEVGVLKSNREVGVFEIDTQQIDRIRKKYPFFQERKLCY